MFTANPAANEQVARLLETVVQWRQDSLPELSVRLGRQDRAGCWDDLSLAAVAVRKRQVRSSLAEAETIFEADCTDRFKTDLWLLKYAFCTYLDGTQFNNHLFPLSSFEGIQIDIHGLVKSVGCKDVTGYRKFIERLKGLPKRVDQTIEALEEGIRTGCVPHEFALMRVAEQLEVLVEEEFENTPLMPPLPCPDLSTHQQEDLRKEIVAAWEEHARPALRELRQFYIREYSEKLRAKEGLHSLRNGGLWYAQCLKFHISCNMTPQEAHQWGLREVRRIREKMINLTKALELGDDPWETYHSIHDNPRNFVGTEEELLELFADICVEQILPKVSQIFHKISDNFMKMAKVPDDMADVMPDAYYQPFPGTTMDDAGALFVNVRELLARPVQYFMSLCLHEGEAGHHKQCQYAKMLGDRAAAFKVLEDDRAYLAPACFSHHEAFIEGWALYMEALGEELELYDKESLFCRYVTEVHRAARLVVDTGIHALGWSFKEAKSFMTENTFARQEWITDELQKVITWPGRGCSHKIGEMKIWNLRRKCEEELGENFSLPDFHAFVLGNGPVPLAFLDHEVDDFLVRGQGEA